MDRRRLPIGSRNRLLTPIEASGARHREIKRRSRVVQVFPSESSLLRLVGAVMCDQAETWSGSRYFSERKMAEMHDAAFRMGAAGEHDWAELEKAARKMIESSLELADSVEAA